MTVQCNGVVINQTSSHHRHSAVCSLLRRRVSTVLTMASTTHASLALLWNCVPSRPLSERRGSGPDHSSQRILGLRRNKWPVFITQDRVVPLQHAMGAEDQSAHMLVNVLAVVRSRGGHDGFTACNRRSDELHRQLRNLIAYMSWMLYPHRTTSRKARED